MKCSCGHRLIVRSKTDSKIRVRALAVIFNDDGSQCALICPACKKEIQVPMMLDPRAIPAEPKLVLRMPLTKERSPP